jgi:hypothetical protein
MPQRRPDIVRLDWDDRNQRHVEEHIDAFLIDDLIAGGDWLAFRNYRGHPPEHRLFIGQTPAGIFVTAVLREPIEDDPGVWRPITGWLSTTVERNRFRAAMSKQRKGRG